MFIASSLAAVLLLTAPVTAKVDEAPSVRGTMTPEESKAAQAVVEGCNKITDDILIQILKLGAVFDGYSATATRYKIFSACITLLSDKDPLTKGKMFTVPPEGLELPAPGSSGAGPTQAQTPLSN